MSDAESLTVPVAATIEDTLGALPDKKAPSPATQLSSTPTAISPWIGSKDEEAAENLPITDTAGGDGDSEAETLIESPEKRKNIVDGASRLEPSTREDGKENDIQFKMDNTNSDGKSRKRKRGEEEKQTETFQNDRPSSRRSSPLSSPVPDAHLDDSDSGHSSPRSMTRPRRLGLRDWNVPERGRPRDSERKPRDDRTSGNVRIRKRRPSDILQEHSSRRPTHQRPGLEATSMSERRETRSATFPRQSSEERSMSPGLTQRREHKRVASSQSVLSSSITLHKKKRAPAPLMTANHNRTRSTDRRSVSSEASSSPAPSRPHLHKVTSAENDALSPAKAIPPRKTRDKNGRTFLARACANNDLEGAKARYEERPEDLNIADNAGNTPLQIASLEGFVEIVEFLLDKKCEIDTKNIDNETSLIDAVENGHVEVIKLLLGHGANPRLGNKEGDEPYELVPDDEKRPEIRKLLADAKARDAKRRRSDDQSGHASTTAREGSSRAASAASQRDSPPTFGQRSPPPFLTSRRRTGRSEFTRNDLLWQANTQENLTKLAGQGDVQGVASILNILQRAEPESLIAAAKGKHDEVLQYLLGIGNPDPDPDPIRTSNLKPGYNTPLLAAIGRGNTAVIQLLVSQAGFNPTREFRGRTYPELSRDRKGENWEKEHEILKTAYDKYNASKSRKHGSPRKYGDAEKEVRRQARHSSSPGPLPQTKNRRSPSTNHKDVPSKTSGALRDMKRDISGASRHSGDHKRHSFRDANSGDHASVVTSDYDIGARQQKTQKPRRRQSDVPAVDVEGETHKRRRLVSGKEHRRRSSSSASDEDDSSTVHVKHEEREKPLLKRTRNSITPERPRSRDSDLARAMVKKRRIVSDSSPEEAKSTIVKTKISRDGQEGKASVAERTDTEDAIVVDDDNETLRKARRNKDAKPRIPHAEITLSDPMEDVKDSGPARGLEAERQIKLREEAEAAGEAKRVAQKEEARIEAERVAAEAAARQAEMERLVAERKRAEEKAERRRVEEEAQRKRIKEEAERKRVEEEAERKRVEEETERRRIEEAERKRLEEEAERKKAEEAERRRVEEEAERKRVEEAERRRFEEAERKRFEEAERKRVEDLERKKAEEEAERKKAEEEAERKRLEEEAERKRLEEVARKKAEEAEERRKAEEAAAKKKAEEEALLRKKEEEERHERLRKEAEDRQRRMEERKQRELLEAERRRQEALPRLLCRSALMLDQGDPTVRNHAWLGKFLPLFTVRTKQIDPDCRIDVEDEEWIPSFQAAGLLATKDLNLRQYTSIEKRSVNERERESLWRIARNMLSYDYDVNAFNTSIGKALQMENEARPKFFAMQELFWVKLLDFKDQIYRHTHLLGLNLKAQRIGIHTFGLFKPAPPPPPPAQSSTPPILEQASSPSPAQTSTTNGLSTSLTAGIINQQPVGGAVQLVVNGAGGANGYVSH